MLRTMARLHALGVITIALAARAVLAQDTAPLTEVLDAMQGAVRAGDRDAYLACIDQRDPEFAMEQRHWADDLARHLPREFRLEIVNDPDDPADDPVLADTRASATLRVSYLMPAGHASRGDGKRATWRGVFEHVDPDADGPLPARWLYAGEDWLTLEGAYPTGDDAAPGRFVVRYFPGSEKAARDVLAAFPGAKEHADAELGVRVTRPLQIKLYQSMEHLKAWVYLSMPDEVLGGWNEPGESIKFMDNYTSGERRWRGALAHEYGHAATWELGPKPKALPWWMAEGIAELVAETFTHNADAIQRMMLQMSEKGRLCTWEEIADYDKAEQRVKRMAYHQGQHLMKFVTEQWGREKRNAWIAGVASGTPLDDATRASLGISFAQLDERWRQSLRGENGQEAPQKSQTPPGGD